MKKLLLSSLFLISASIVFSQKINERVYSSYSEDELATIISEQPEMVSILNYAVDHACYITNAPSGKSIDDFETINWDSEAVPSFTDLKKKIEKQNQYFLISGTNKMLVIKSEWVLKNEMENQQK